MSVPYNRSVDAFAWNCINQVRKKNRPQSAKQRVAFAFRVKMLKQHLRKITFLCVCVCKLFAAAYGVQSVWARERYAWTEKIGSTFYFQAKKKKKRKRNVHLDLYSGNFIEDENTHTHTEK